jgi:hypothetical protein
MAVQRLPNPPLTPSSMLSGGQMGEDKHLLDGSGLGSWGAAPEPGDLSFAQHLPEPVASTDGYDREQMSPSGSKSPGVLRGPDGRWRQADTADAGQPEWRPTPSSS